MFLFTLYKHNFCARRCRLCSSDCFVYTTCGDTSNTSNYIRRPAIFAARYDLCERNDWCLNGYFVRERAHSLCMCVCVERERFCMSFLCERWLGALLLCKAVLPFQWNILFWNNSQELSGDKFLGIIKDIILIVFVHF